MITLNASRFWTAKSPFDKELLFASATLLWEAACEYFDWCYDHPLVEKRNTGKDGKEVENELLRAFTIEGLCGYLDCSRQYYDSFKADCDDKDILEVFARIEDAIYRQKFEAAAAGLLNATIVSKDLRSADKDKALNHLSPTIIDWSNNHQPDAKAEGSSADSSN